MIIIIVSLSRESQFDWYLSKWKVFLFFFFFDNSLNAKQCYTNITIFRIFICRIAYVVCGSLVMVLWQWIRSIDRMTHWHANSLIDLAFKTEDSFALRTNCSVQMTNKFAISSIWILFASRCIMAMSHHWSDGDTQLLHFNFKRKIYDPDSVFTQLCYYQYRTCKSSLFTFPAIIKNNCSFPTNDNTVDCDCIRVQLE